MPKTNAERQADWQRRARAALSAREAPRGHERISASVFGQEYAVDLKLPVTDEARDSAVRMLVTSIEMGRFNTTSADEKVILFRQLMAALSKPD